MRGLYTVFEKELADYFISWRGIILFAVVLMATVIAIYGALIAWEAVAPARPRLMKISRKDFSLS